MLSDFPKIYSPFIRQTFPVEKEGFKKATEKGHDETEDQKKFD